MVSQEGFLTDEICSSFSTVLLLSLSLQVICLHLYYALNEDYMDLRAIHNDKLTDVVAMSERGL